MTPIHCTCVDLAGDGLNLIASQDPRFNDLLGHLRQTSVVFGPDPPGDGRVGAILQNETGQALIGLIYVWRNLLADGTWRTNRLSNLGSSMQSSVLMGRSLVTRDLHSFILPRALRLLTERGLWGDNASVLGPSAAVPSGWISARGTSGGTVAYVGGAPPTAEIEIILDFVIREDGLCLGPDEGNNFWGIQSALETQRQTAEAALQALQRGASPGPVFEILRPLARQGRERSVSRRSQHASFLLESFAHMAIHQLIHAEAEQLIAFFADYAKPSLLPLRRP